MEDSPVLANPNPSLKTGAPQQSGTRATPDPQTLTDSRWSRALERLREKPKLYESFDCLRSELSNDSEKFASGMLDVIEKKRLRLESRRWTLPLKIRGQSKSIKSSLDTLFQCIKAVKDVGSAVASLDPIHAGIPWACVSVILDVALSESEQHQAALDGITKITPLVAQYTRVETLYLSPERQVSLKPEFEECLTDLYASILEYQIEMASHCARSFPIRLLRAVPKLDDWAGMLAGINDKNSKCREFMSIFDAEQQGYHHETLMSFFEKQLAEIKNTSAETLKTFLQEKEITTAKDILAWISNADFIHDHDFILDEFKMGSNYSDSGKWLRTHAEYKKWATEKLPDPNTFWLKGVVGVGKTSLICRLIEWQLSDLNTKDDERIGFFYCSNKRGSPEGTEPRVILSSLLRQLGCSKSGHSVASQIQDAYENGETGTLTHKSLSLSRCTELLSEILTAFVCTTIIIDALDECSNPKELLSRLHTIASKAPNKVKLCFSGREDVNVRDFFKGCTFVQINSGLTSSDVKFFVETEVKGRQGALRLLGGKYPKLEDQLVTVLCERAQGMFRLAQLQLGIFFHGKRTYHNHLDVEKQIEKLRENTTLPELNNVYQEIYGLNTNIDSIDRQLADKAYKLLLGAQRLLRLRELGAAVRTTTDNTNLDFVNATYLLEITANFIIAEEDDMNPVQLAHASVQEFLRTLNIEGSSRFTDVSVHAQAAETCLASLNCDQVWTPLPPLTDAEMNYETPREKTTSLTIHKFARYAALYWPRHSELAGATMRASGPLQKQLTTFLHNKEYAPFSQWTENLGHVRYGYSDSFGERFQDCEGATPLHITSIWDLSDVASHILKGTSTDCHEFNDRGDAPIHLAVKYRHPRTLRLLASHMSDALEFQNDKGLTVLHVAVKYSPLQLLSDLLDMGGNVDSKTKAGDTLLDLAIYQKNIPAVDLLLSRNASLTEINSEGDTALHRAAKSSRTVMEHLLRHGADVGIKNAYGQTPLHTVADWYPEDLGLIAKAKLLVDFGADPNARDENGKSALHVAAASGRKNIMEVIIEQAANVDINIKDNHGNSPLRFAATEEIADALVRAGADVNQRKPRRSYTIEAFEGPS